MASRTERIRATFEAFNGGGVEPALDMFDPNVTWLAPPEWMDEAVYCGHEGLRDLDARWRQNFDDFGLTLEEISEVGDRYVVTFVQHGLIRGSGVRVDQRAAWVIEFGANDLVTHLRGFFSWDEAMEAAQP